MELMVNGQWSVVKMVRAWIDIIRGGEVLVFTGGMDGRDGMDGLYYKKNKSNIQDGRWEGY
jgi:hypothetical protein